MSSLSHIASPPYMYMYLCKCHNEFRDIVPLSHVKFHGITIIKCDYYSLRSEVLICEIHVRCYMISEYIP